MLALTLTNMPAGLYSEFKYFSLTVTIHLPYSDIRI